MSSISSSTRPNYRVKNLALPYDRQTVSIIAIWRCAPLLAASCPGLRVEMPDGPVSFPRLRWQALVPSSCWQNHLSDYSQTGPRIREEILSQFRRYTLFAMARLGLWAFALHVVHVGRRRARLLPVSRQLGLDVVCGSRRSDGDPWALRRDRAPVHSQAAFQSGTPGRLHALPHEPPVPALAMGHTCPHSRHSRRDRILGGSAGSERFVGAGEAEPAGGDDCAMVRVARLTAGSSCWPRGLPEARAPRRPAARQENSAPNILLIGSDTLRADRLGALGYRRALTPNIDAFGAQGVLFRNCYVPCARTAPSLVSMLTGTWPHTHGIRDNFVSDTEARLKVAALPQLLKPLGYRTAALSDWCGSDMGKFAFGFDYTDLPEDQWNLKYLHPPGPEGLAPVRLAVHAQSPGAAAVAGAVLSGRRSAHHADGTPRAPPDFAAGRRPAAVLPECLLFHHAPAVCVGMAVVHALCRSRLCRRVQVRHGQADRSVRDHPPPGRAEGRVRPRSDHRSVRRLRRAIR